ncbi:hypothetical protein HS088_TW20G00711 [Tripterygium wilfordii]|uniref:Uncharacterized protein n=1 Tax=Tripterygium wilfordii TaxID=458696 RepID=A0A7J7C869_TRIWF|nr:nuclear polyadenylated RNA-binding protein 3 isoform X1 [Tripterygium wilfordii]KAF5730338.1 hypothetical protein HS088_TW20G00711 [Tripterygium wilfordii]
MLRTFSLQARNLLHSVPKKKAIPSPSLVRLAGSNRSRLRLFSSKSNSPSNDVDDVDSQELKRRIDKFYEGDADAVPSIFEAILKRKLSGKHEDSDDELVKELQERLPITEADDEETDSDTDSSETDEEEFDIDSYGSHQEVNDSDTTKQRRGREE